MAGYRSFTAFWLGGAGDLIVEAPVVPEVPEVPVPERVCNGRWSTKVITMPQSVFPFERIMVDHVFRGTTRVWWRLDPLLTTPPPHLFKLEASYVGTPSALDWVPLTEELDATYLTYDTTRELTGKNLFTHFRVILEAGGQTFYSNAMPIWGTLTRGNWGIAREIVRKHKLHQQGTAIEGYLIRRMRYGTPDPESRDYLTSAQIRSFRKTSWGTPFKVGYHPPVRFDIEIDPPKIRETRGGTEPTEYSAKPDVVMATAVAFPQVLMEDIWVNSFTDERWRIGDINRVSTLQGVPLIIKAELKLIPHNDIVYQIPVDEWSYDPLDTDTDALPTTGDGCVTVDHDYPENESMTYTTAECCAIEGASIWIFTKDGWDEGNRLLEDAVATSITTTAGRWAYAVKLDPGIYVVQFMLAGRYGPDIIELVVTDPDATIESSSLSSSVSVAISEAADVYVDSAYGMF